MKMLRGQQREKEGVIKVWSQGARERGKGPRVVSTRKNSFKVKSG